MKLKSAALFAFICCALTAVTYVLYILINLGIVSVTNPNWSYDKIDLVYKIFNIAMNAIHGTTAISLATFFYQLYKSKK